MTDNQRLADEIRAFLQSADPTQADRLKELTRRYAEACREVNNRLRRCDEYLKKGLRGEAIHFAQAEPDLQVDVEALEMPELPQFLESIRANTLPEPPHLLLDVAGDLNHAYADEQSLPVDLLPRHRRLALLRAPLSERLQVMRQIAKIDKANPVWSDDIRVFEAARLREIQAAMDATVKIDAVRLEELSRELSQPDWLMPPPIALVEQVNKQAAVLGRERARSELASLVQQMAGAMEKADLSTVQTLCDRYQQLKTQTQLADNESLAVRASRVLKWLAQKEKAQLRELDVQTALAAVEDALARSAAPEEVAQLYDEALRLMKTLPARLEERYQTYMIQAGAVRRWRENLILIIVFVFGVILLIALITSVVLSRNSSSQSASDAILLAVSCPTDTVATSEEPAFVDSPRGNRNG